MREVALNEQHIWAVGQVGSWLISGCRAVSWSR
jgi:hypothetical protein